MDKNYHLRHLQQKQQIVIYRKRKTLKISILLLLILKMIVFLIFLLKITFNNFIQNCYFQIKNKQQQIQNMNHLHVLTNIKNSVQKQQQAKYKQQKQKSTKKYYQLYLPKIIFIQQRWRNYLVTKNKKLQQQALQQMSCLMRNKSKNKQLHEKLQQVKKQKEYQQNIDPNIQYQKYYKNLQKQLKESILNVMQTADRNAKIKAVLKIQISTFEQITKNNQSLKKQCRNLQKQTFLVRQKNKNLTDKLSNLRKAITMQRNQISLLKNSKTHKDQMTSY